MSDGSADTGTVRVQLKHGSDDAFFEDLSAAVAAEFGDGIDHDLVAGSQSIDYLEADYSLESVPWELVATGATVGVAFEFGRSVVRGAGEELGRDLVAFVREYVQDSDYDVAAVDEVDAGGVVVVESPEVVEFWERIEDGENPVDVAADLDGDQSES